MSQAYYDAPIPVDNRAHEAPIPVDGDAYIATFGGQKVVVGAHTLESPWPAPTPDEAPATRPPPSTGATAGTICGLRRRTFYTVLAVAVVLLIGAVAGLAGGLVSQRNQANAGDSSGALAPGSDSNSSSISATSTAPSSSSTASSGSSTPLLASPMLDNSQIAASGFGNASVTVTYVAYQDPVGSLMLGTWDSNNVTWRAVNITDRMLSSGNPVHPKLGTPLAIATSFGAHVVVIFLNEDNIIRAVHTEKDGYYMAWKPSGLYAPGQASISAQPQSRLATYWLWCIKCTASEDGQGKIRLFSEREPGVLQSHLDKEEDSNFSGTRGRAGSGLAVTSRRDASSEAWLVLFFDAGEKLGMMTRKSATDSAWVLDEAFSGATHPTFPGQQIVGGTFDVDYANGTAMADMVTLAVQLEKDGSLAASWWDPRTQAWTFGSPVELREGPQPPPAFSAIAMINQKFYGMTDGTVLEYTVDKDTVNHFVFTGKPVTR